ncbi:MAG: EAL domain-containing protein, partial [Hyphomicrobiaceae bacterium]
GAFVKNLLSDNSDQVFIRTMVEIAATFGMKTVAEWVADQETAAALADAGIDYLQGFLYGMPIPAEDYVD